MQKRIIIIDGYNVVHRIPRWAEQLDASLERGREALLIYCRRWMQTRGDVWLFVVVFDGDSEVTAAHSSAGPGVRVLYTQTGETADDRILELTVAQGEVNAGKDQQKESESDHQAVEEFRHECPDGFDALRN